MKLFSTRTPLPARLAFATVAALPALALPGCAGNVQARIDTASQAQGDAEAGAGVFIKYCTGCHGDDGRKIKRHDLTSDKVRNSTPARLAKIIIAGDDDMPPMGDKVSDAEVGHLVAWLKRGQEIPAVPPDQAPPAEGQPAGGE